MPKIKQNRFVGFGLSLVLKDNETWIRAQRFCGFCFVLVGFISLIFSFFCQWKDLSFM